MILAVFVFAIALTANVAFASFPSFPGCGNCQQQQQCPCPATNINQTNSGNIYSITKGEALTGGNWASSGVGFSSVMSGAGTASAITQNQLGWNAASLTGVTTGSLNVNQSNQGNLYNTTKAAALTGGNKAMTGFGGAMVVSGAGNTGASSINIVGYNITTK